MYGFYPYCCYYPYAGYYPYGYFGSPMMPT
ncbi:unnamed protein product, partial [Rotaria sp. Silwood1]